MRLDTAWTPDAVVASVIIYNAAFGYRYGLLVPRLGASTIDNAYFMSLVAGDPFHGYIHQR
jgi:hypothetical protein